MERARGYKQKKKGTNKTLGVEANEKNKGKLSVSSMDFVGLGFADKKDGRTLPAGLVPIADDFAQGNLPEVEIIVGDSSNFGAATPKPQGDDPPDLNKPKVSSWGVFPRPNDISKTFGGGRVIRPGEVLETQEEIAAKEERTRQLVAAYNTKMGLNIDPKLRLDCEKTLKDGDSLMNVGKLKEALPYYEKVMDKLTFKIMTPKARADIHINLPALKKLDSMLIETLDSMVDTEFGYVEGGSRAEGRNRTPGQSKRWWLPSPQVPATGLYRAKNKLLKQGKVVHQVFKAARTINESVLLEMPVPTIIRDALPKSGKASLGEELYKILTAESSSAEEMLNSLNLKSEHNALEVINRLEAAVFSWKERITEQESGRSPVRTSWSFIKDPMSEIDKMESLLDRAERLVQRLKNRYHNLPQTFLDVTKIQYGKDVGHSILEAYSRVLGNLAFSILSRIGDILQEDALNTPNSFTASSYFPGINFTNNLETSVLGQNIRYSFLDRSSGDHRNSDSTSSSIDLVFSYNVTKGSPVTATPSRARVWCIGREACISVSPTNSP